MTPADFPLCDTHFGPPPDLEESQVRTVAAYLGEVPGPNALEGAPMVIVAWKPNEEDIKALQEGGLIYFTAIGGLPPHFLSTKLEQATMQP